MRRTGVYPKKPAFNPCGHMPVRPGMTHSRFLEFTKPPNLGSKVVLLFSVASLFKPRGSFGFVPFF